ncbi:hypothetical protein SERLA73DRAFT_177965 [Serpula lacrymans var. lacrymans S7.3]|uniref:Uncharacterized protein n=2 Tax=Serpula lacrymans var. lacrymans TaxID=341189 RepID=F8PQ66_SERL3|nr:hypothetical protein SERLA73DRAFT_177965 [Serpula lacrymans var. lacrymans S7.3]
MSIQHSLRSLPAASKTKVDAASEQIHSIPSESSTVPGEHTTPHTKKKKTVKNEMSLDQVDSELKMQASPPPHTPHALSTPHISRQTLGTQLHTLTPTEIKLPSSPMSSHKSFGKHSANGAAATSSQANSRFSATDDASSSTLSRPSQSPSLNQSSPSVPLPPHPRGSLPDQQDSMTGDNPSSKSKKKRKRRKKKKMQRDGQARND